MTDFFVFIISASVVIKTIQYGIWTLSEKNIMGGIFVILLSVSTLSLGAYLLLFGGA